MKQVLTERQRELVAMAADLSGKFAERAAVHDDENTFPFENYEDLRKTGLLRLSIPEELGGLGATQPEILPVLERLAAGDGSTALAVTMHISPLGQWSSVWRRTGNPRLAEFLREAAADRLIWASVTSEVGVPNLMTDARTIAEKVDGGYRLTGRKSFATNTAIATHCSTTARYDDPERGPRLMLLRARLDGEGVAIHQTWNTLGMRGTQSNDVEFSGAFIADDDVVHSLPIGHLDATVLQTVFCWAMPAFGSVFTGVALGALEWAIDKVGARRGTDPRVQDTIADCEILLESSRAALYRHAEEIASGRLIEQLSVQEGLARCAFVKNLCTRNASEIVGRLIDVVGGMGYTRALPFQRMWRDVQAGLIMPFNNHAAHELIGSTAFGVEMAPAIELEESGPDSRPKA